MSRSSRVSRASLACGLLLVLARASSAQSAVYLTGSAFADIKRFGSTEDVYYGDALARSLDATGVGGGLRIGTFLHPRWSLELGVDAGTATEVDAPDPYVILAIYPPLPRPDLKASTSFLAVSTVVGFHPPSTGRVHPGYLVGFSFIRGTYKSDYPDYVVLPAAVFTSSSSATSPPSTNRADAIPIIYPPPSFRAVTLTQRDLTGGVILGFEAALDVTRHLAVAPEIRALMFSTPNSGPGVFLIRPGVGVRWKF